MDCHERSNTCQTTTVGAEDAQDAAGARSHSTACPQCRQPDSLIAWTLADHPFPSFRAKYKLKHSMLYFLPTICIRNTSITST